MSQENVKIRLQCPMPKFDFDIITLGHGSGGLLTNKLLESGIFDVLRNPLLDEHHDGAIFELNGVIAFSTDSYVIKPIFFPNSNIGELAVNGTVNDLAMCGAIPKYLSLSFILEEGLAMEEFWEVLTGVKFAAEGAGVQIITGDTKVVEKGKGDKVFVNTTGIGVVHPMAKISKYSVKPGDQIIVSGNLATHGIAIMSVREGLEFETTIESDTAPLNHIVAHLLNRYGSDIHFLRDPTRGGIASALNEIARDIKLGIEIFQNLIPIAEEVYSACELLGLDPLYVANEGVFIAIVDADIADDFVENLRQMKNGVNAAVIGKVVNDHPRQVILNSSIGGKRALNMLVGEQLPRIC